MTSLLHGGFPLYSIIFWLLVAPIWFIIRSEAGVILPLLLWLGLGEPISAEIAALESILAATTALLYSLWPRTTDGGGVVPAASI